MFHKLLGKARLFALAFFIFALAPLARSESVELYNSRWASFSCIFTCFPQDTFQINLTITSSPPTATYTVPPGLYQVAIGGSAYTVFTVNPDGTLAGPDDPTKPYVKTITYGPSPNAGTYDMTIYAVANPSKILYQHPVAVTNTFIWDFYWTFLSIQASYNYMTPINNQVSMPFSLKPVPNPDHQCPCAIGPPGMATFSFNSLVSGISLSDTPIGYHVPRGSPISFTATYNQRDVAQPSVSPYSNLGPGWTFNWISYVMSGPATGQSAVRRYLPGAGVEEYQSFVDESLNPYGAPNGRILKYAPQPITQSVMRAVSSPTSARPDTYQLTLADGTVETYDNNAGGGTNLYLTKRVDPQGNTITINYAPSNAQITSITDALGQVTTFTYGLVSDGLKITKVTDPFGRFASFTYDAHGRLASITDAIGLVSSFTYDPTNGYLNSLTTPYGTTTFSSQDGPDSRVLQATDPLGQTQRLEYQTLVSSFPAQEPAVPSAPGLTINNQNLNYFNTYYWDKQAYATAIGAGASPGSAAFYNYAHVSHWAQEQRGLSGTASSEKTPLEGRIWLNFQGQTSPDYIDPAGTNLPTLAARLLDDGSTQLHQKTYNLNGYVTQSIDPLGRETDSVYAANGQDLIQTTQKNGASNEQLFAATYNSIHLPLTATDAAGQTTTTTYNGFGQPLTVTNPKGEVTTMAYNANGYLLTVTGAIPGSTTTYTYDAAGRVQTVADSEGYTVTNTYDNLDRPTKQSFPDGTFRQTVYDRLSVGSTTDRLGRTRAYTNDGLGRVIQIKDPLNRIINQTWCACGSIKTLQDGKGNTTTWNYDVQGRRVSKVFADGKGDSFLYETSTSRLKSKTDALAQTTSYGYAKDDTLVSITYTNARNPTPNVSFAYDSIYNRRISMIDGTGTTTYSYYPVNGAIGAGKLQNVAGPLANSTISYTYDQLGRVVGRSINGAANQTSLVYDALGRVTSETNGLGAFSTAYVNQTARPLQVNYPTGQAVNYSYFNNVGDQRLQGIQNLGPGSASLSQFDYTYDAEGEILSWARQFGGSSAGSYTLGYDLAGQLTSAALSGPSSQSFIYAYDPSGNRTNETINSAANPITVNTLNELVSRTGSNPRSFAYDADGELISNNGASRSSTNYTYQYDAENRLIAINYPTTNQSTQFTFDGFGRRVKLVEKTGATITSTKQFIWDGLSIAEERDGSGSLTKRFFSQGQVNGSTQLYYTRDHLGSIREVTNNGGSLQARYDYDPYGRRSLTTGSDVADFGFTGHYYHEASKLHLAPRRSYDADSARWLSRDPSGNAETQQGSTLYSYVSNVPVLSIDVLGLEQVRFQVQTEIVRPPYGFLPVTGLKSVDYFVVDSDSGNPVYHWWLTGVSFPHGLNGRFQPNDSSSKLGPCTLVVHQDGQAWTVLQGVPFSFLGAPSKDGVISYFFTYVLDLSSHTGLFFGDHRAYPSYTVSVNGGIIYFSDETTLSDLEPGNGERAIIRSFVF